MLIRQTPVTYVGNSIITTNSTITGVSTNIGGVFSSYSNAFSTSNLSVWSSFLMSNVTPGSNQANFYSTLLFIRRGNVSISNTTVDNAGVCQQWNHTVCDLK